MSEIKRVALSTFEPQKVNDKVNKKACKTIRISVILPESNEDKCPEYNYKDQLAAVKKRSKQSKESNNIENGLDPFGEDDDDVKRIALEMEAKYGSAGLKKKRKGRKDDYADIGMGYDESDSFIDNTDGYDEIIPQNVTTLHGGFYINCGALEFKTDEEASSEFSSSSSDSEDDDKIQSTSRKRVLETSEDSDSDTANPSQLEKKPKLHSSKNTMQQAIKKKLFSQNKIQVKKRRLIDPHKKTVKELLREKREDLNMSVPTDMHGESLLQENMEKDSLKENKKPMSITSVTDAIESVVKRTGDIDYDSNQIKQNNDVNMKNDLLALKPDAPSSVEGESSQDGQKIDRVEVKLPENLPSDILDLINKIKQAALGYKGEGIKKFFTDEVNSMLLKLERNCKILGKSSRVKVYDHLAFFIKCRRETVSRRAKNLIHEDEERRLKKLMDRLKDCVSLIMPSLVQNYEQESQRIIQRKFSKESIENEENKALKMPRKRFQWSDETRKLMKDILSIKKRCLLLEGKQKDNLEEQITQYLKTQIVPFWPEGWVHLNTLKKMYDNMSENSKMSDNNNLTGSKKSHSNITITPVAVTSSKTNTNGNKSEVPNDITLTKIINEVKPTPKLPETSSANYQTSSIKIESTAATIKPTSHLSGSAIRETEKPKLEIDHDVKKSHIVSGAVLKEAEKTKHDNDRDHKKNPKTHFNHFGAIKEQENHKYDKDHDYRKNVVTKTSIIQSSSTPRDDEKSNHEKDQDYRKIIIHEKDNDFKEFPMYSRDSSNLIKPVAETGVIVINAPKEEFTVTKTEEKLEPCSVIPMPIATHCQVIDLTDPSERKVKLEEPRPFDLSKEASPVDLIKHSNSRDVYPDPKMLSTKHPDLSFTPNLFCTSTPKVSKSDGDDIQMVMENLKALQKLSSPIKAENPTGSPVSVIAYNKSFSPKSNNSSQSSAGQRTDFGGKNDFGSKNDFAGTFRDEFQQQFINSLQQLAASSSSTMNHHQKDCTFLL